MSIANPTNDLERRDREAVLADLREEFAEWRSDYLRVARRIGDGHDVDPLHVLVCDRLLLASGRLLATAAWIGAVIDLRRPWPEEEESAR